MDNKTVKAIIIIPFYDNDIYEMLDTLESIKYYLGDTIPIICLNDCKKKESIDFFEKKSAEFKNVINFVPLSGPDWPRNGYGPLFCKIYQGMEYALKHFHFEYFIKIDADALVTGSELLLDLDKYFAMNGPSVGLLGSYKIRTDGKRRTRWRWALYLLYLIYFKRILSSQSVLWKVCLREAIKNGYKLGESVLGGVYIFSNSCARRVVELYPYQSVLEDKIYLTKIGEDVIFSLLVFASQFRLSDFGQRNDPLAIAQKYLPLSKEEIIKRKKQVIHSLKEGLNGESQAELRAFFKSFRR